MHAGMGMDAEAGRGQEVRLGAVIGTLLGLPGKGQSCPRHPAHVPTMQKNQRTEIPE